ncbi:MAG: 50S ribosomal protein L22 [Parcubacteria group bacterium GW2011_GWA2_39_18]|nr:MAG: 50S ribosomal protein L22 [Parcubacteria group bacterium GW2011_GWA2_39_18]
MEMLSKINNLSVAPRKVRLAADLIRGKKISEAKTQMQFLTKGVADIILKVLKSAEANAKHNFKIADTDNLIVSKIFVDEGKKLKRSRPRARGSAYLVRKRTSHTTLVLSAGPTSSLRSGSINSESKNK